MNQPAHQNELLHHLCGYFGLTELVAAQVINEVLAYHNQSFETFIHQRHRELQEAGIANKQAYQIIRQDMSERRFPAPQLSERQIRRIIYG